MANPRLRRTAPLATPSSRSREVSLGRFTFENVSCDAPTDVLYLHMGDPSTAVDFDESPEGHALRFDADGVRLPQPTGIPMLVLKRRPRL